MKRFAVIAALGVVVFGGSAGSLFSVEQKKATNSTALPPLYGPDAQRARAKQQDARSSGSSSRQLEQAQPKKSDILTGNMGEIVAYARELDITKEQIQSLQEIEQEFQQKGKAIADNAFVFRLDISKELKKAEPDFQSIQDKYKLLNDIQYQIRLAILESYEKSLAVLTPDQKARYIQLVNEKKESAPAKAPAPSAKPSQAPPPSAPRNDAQPSSDDGDF